MASICHGPWVLVSADVVEGRRLTSYRRDGVPDEVEEQGGEWVDEEVVVDKNLVTSRMPDDIPAFNDAIVEMLRASGGPPEKKKEERAA